MPVQSSYAFQSLVTRKRVANTFSYAASPIDKEIIPPTMSASMLVTPYNNLVISGEEGGPFDYYAIIYTITNAGGAPLSWSVSSDEAWVSLSSSSGTLLPGESENVTITADADTLPIGLFSATVSFTNVTNGTGDTTRTVSASVTGEAALAMEGRTSSGTATLIGHSEFALASSPPKKYLVKTLSGTLVICNYGNFSSCGGGPNPSTNGQFTYQYSGALSYDPVTGALTDTTVRMRDNATVRCGQPANLVNLGATTTAVETITAGTAFNRSVTQTTNVQTSDMTCVAGGILHAPNPERVTSVSNRDDLSVEDTEQNAINRMTNAGSWSAWSAVSAVGDIATEIQLRVAGFSFSAQQAQIRLTGSGLAPNYAYSGTVDIYRRDYGTSDPWVLVGTAPISGTSDGSGNITITDDIDGVAGYEYSAFNAKLIVS